VSHFVRQYLALVALLGGIGCQGNGQGELLVQGIDVVEYIHSAGYLYLLLVPENDVVCSLKRGGKSILGMHFLAIVLLS